MPTIHVVCPKCKKKLETSSQNEGRQAVCPQCESRFDLNAVSRKLGKTKRSEAPEYSDGTLVGLALALAVVLILLAGSALGGWSHTAGQARAYLAGQKAGILAGSLACAALVLLAWKGRKSLAPAVLVSTGWTLAAAIWVAGTIRLLSKAGQILPEGMDTALRGGIYVTLLSACLAFGLAVYLCFLLRDERIFPRLLLFAGLAILAGLVGGGCAVAWHVKPALTDQSAAAPASSSAAEDGAAHVLAEPPLRTG
jgi:DNA-directed RNA polymerase subunit RPC12/RpoP